MSFRNSKGNVIAIFYGCFSDMLLWLDGLLTLQNLMCSVGNYNGWWVLFVTHIFYYKIEPLVMISGSVELEFYFLTVLSVISTMHPSKLVLQYLLVILVQICKIFYCACLLLTLQMQIRTHKPLRKWSYWDTQELVNMLLVS